MPTVTNLRVTIAKAIPYYSLSMRPPSLITSPSLCPINQASCTVPLCTIYQVSLRFARDVPCAKIAVHDRISQLLSRMIQQDDVIFQIVSGEVSARYARAARERNAHADRKSLSLPQEASTTRPPRPAGCWARGYPSRRAAPPAPPGSSRLPAKWR